jgi:signal transduction histidine kinase
LTVAFKRKSAQKVECFFFCSFRYLAIRTVSSTFIPYKIQYLHIVQRIISIFCIITFALTSVQSQDKFVADSSYSYPDLTRHLEQARLSKDQSTLAAIYRQMADYEGNVLTNYEKSIEFYRRSYEYYKVLGNTMELNKINLAISDIYVDAGLPTDAIDILQKLLTYNTTDQGFQAKVCYILNRAHKSRGDLEIAGNYLRKAQIYLTDVDDPKLKAQIIFDKIQNFELAYELDSALVAAFEAFKINTELNELENVAKSLFHIGYINKQQKDYAKAIKYLLKSEEIAPKQAYSNTRKMIYKELADAFALNKNHEVGFKYLRKYSMLNDSILNKNKIESYTNLAIKYGTIDKQSSIAVLTIDKQAAEEKNIAQRRVLYILGGGLALLLSALYFIIKFYDQRITSAKIIAEQKEEINQQNIRELEDNMKMSSMRAVIEGQETERERIAKDLHDSLGGLLSTIKLHFEHARSKKRDDIEIKEYQKAHELLDTAVDEVRAISQDLQPSALINFGLVAAIKDLINRFEAEDGPEIEFQYYDLPPKIDKMISMSIYRIIQELLNNSLKHAQAEEILIQLNADSDEIVIQYEDDGVGFDEKTLVKKGMGLENIRSRVNFLHGSLVMDSAKGKGISVLIRIKAHDV